MRKDRDMKELEISAVKENLGQVLAFIEQELRGMDCPSKVKTQIDIAVEEIFVNIASYAYNPGEGPAQVRVEVQDDPLEIILTFLDHGKPYDPLAREDPDVTLPAEKRRIGGLGIFLVKKSMDEINYEYKNGHNILTMKKCLK